jgi:hypothetical protein
LSIQREQQKRLIDEMFSPISNQILPASIEERLNMYRYRNKLEDMGTEYKIIKQKFLNYRQFSFKLTKNKKDVIPAYALSYSTLSKKKAQGRIDFELKNVYYFNREEIKFITLEFFNSLYKVKYKDINELIFNPPTIEDELFIRKNLTDNEYDLSPIIIIDEILNAKLTIELDAITYEDTRERVIIT